MCLADEEDLTGPLIFRKICRVYNEGGVYMTNILITVYMIMWASIIWKEAHEIQERLDKGREPFKLEWIVMLLRAWLWPIVLIINIGYIIGRTYKNKRT